MRLSPPPIDEFWEYCRNDPQNMNTIEISENSNFGCVEIRESKYWGSEHWQPCPRAELCKKYNIQTDEIDAFFGLPRNLGHDKPVYITKKDGESVWDAVYRYLMETR